jgi:hypothetical protein
MINTTNLYNIDTTSVFYRDVSNMIKHLSIKLYLKTINIHCILHCFLHNTRFKILCHLHR